NLAVIYKERKLYEKAIQILDKGILENPSQGFLYYNRACCYVHMDKLSETFYDVRKSVELDELFFDYMKKDMELNPIRDLEEYKEYVKHFEKYL
ncbi:MAG: TPR end-of-group domain-containing protein, partial [Clostridium sp.]